MPSIYERHARAAKASRLALTLQRAVTDQGNAGEVARALSAEQRRMVEAAAGVKPASEATWQMVVELLTPQQEQAERAREAEQHNRRAVQRWLNGSYSHGA